MYTCGIYTSVHVFLQVNVDMDTAHVWRSGGNLPLLLCLEGGLYFLLLVAILPGGEGEFYCLYRWSPCRIEHSDYRCTLSYLALHQFWGSKHSSPHLLALKHLPSLPYIYFKLGAGESLFILFLRQDLIYPRLAFKLMFSWPQPWVPNHSASISQVLGLHTVSPCSVHVERSNSYFPIRSPISEHFSTWKTNSIREPWIFF